MTCNNCTNASARPHWGGYSFDCVECCARLVLNTRPCKHKATAMLDAIARFRGAPKRSDILACAKLKLEKPL